ncbi:MAG: flagellar motor protein PomA [Methylohalobius sp.]|nr:flagellar motor protein PomA [Methylohalobius sp.]
MDIATLIGFLGGLGIIIAAIATGGNLSQFVDVPSILIVLGGTVMVVLMKFTLSDFLRSFSVAARAFFNKQEDPVKLIEEVVRLADVARKNGLLALENETVNNPFLKKGINMCVDGYDPALIRKMLSEEIHQTIKRHETGRAVWQAVGDVAPAFGMIGTLVGLVQMLANMSDPSSIGPAMAVAILTTLYGAVLANAIALPLADKLALVSSYEQLSKALIVEAIGGIQEGLNPKILGALLNTYLPEKKRPSSE